MDIKDKLNPHLVNAMSLIAQGYLSESEEEGEIEHDTLKQSFIATKMKQITEIVISTSTDAVKSEPDGSVNDNIKIQKKRRDSDEKKQRDKLKTDAKQKSKDDTFKHMKSDSEKEMKSLSVKSQLKNVVEQEKVSQLPGSDDESGVEVKARESRNESEDKTKERRERHKRNHSSSPKRHSDIKDSKVNNSNSMRRLLYVFLGSS